MNLWGVPPPIVPGRSPQSFKEFFGFWGGPPPHQLNFREKSWCLQTGGVPPPSNRSSGRNDILSRFLIKIDDFLIWINILVIRIEFSEKKWCIFIQAKLMFVMFFSYEKWTPSQVLISQCDVCVPGGRSGFMKIPCAYPFLEYPWQRWCWCLLLLYLLETKARRGDREDGRLYEGAEGGSSRGTHGHSLH